MAAAVAAAGVAVVEEHHWLPRQGQPTCVVDRIVQQLVKLLALLPVYTAVVATLIILILVFGLPWK